MDNELIRLFENNKPQHAFIAVLFKGTRLPRYCAPMLRDPKPQINILLNNNLSEIYFSAIKKNASIEDGAILIQLRGNTPIIRGFSYILYPPPLKVSRLKNMGSGYNSALDFSGIKRVLCVYFINKNGIKKYINGKEKVLMKIESKNLDTELYKGTHEYYMQYRPNVPKEVIDIVIEHFDIKLSDRILDIGCGTGQVPLVMNSRCKEMVCLDPDPEMIKIAKKVTKNSQTKMIWINSRAEELGKLKREIGVFKIAMFSRSFHWIDQDQVLKDINTLIDKDGGVAIFSDRSLWTGQEDWQQVVKKIVQKYLGEKRRAGKNMFKESGERWEDIVGRSPFSFIKTQSVVIVRYWNTESILGYLFSTSFAAPHLFGDQLHKFRKEVEDTLLKLDPKGIFQEKASWSIILGSKKLR